MRGSQPGLRGRLPAALAVLLLACAALLTIGACVEHRSGSDHHDTQTAATGESGRENAEQPGHTEGDEGKQPEAGAGAHTEQPRDESKETVLDVPVESPAAVAAMGAVSVALAAPVWRRPVRPVAAVLAAFTVGAAVLDVAEVAHQVTENRTGLAALAGLIAALRLLTAAGAAALWWGTPRDGRPEEEQQQQAGELAAPAVS
ncbi:hypothetical protein ABZV34_33890 [Streptomyces sp. NPDC005195]|uniref:hypothetical protein n=1 Tax=Streptomyces sp. NPDC005195 TaxID=3154561 RepID=UPI0033BF73F8